MSQSKKQTQGEPSTAKRREAIEADLRTFLESGNKIQQIPTGVSGQDNMPRSKHIVLGRGNKR